MNAIDPRVISHYVPGPVRGAARHRASPSGQHIPFGAILLAILVLGVLGVSLTRRRRAGTGRSATMTGAAAAAAYRAALATEAPAKPRACAGPPRARAPCRLRHRMRRAAVTRAPRRPGRPAPPSRSSARPTGGRWRRTG